jgi:hypothetical protein
MLYYQEALEHFKQVESEANRQAKFLLQKIELETHLFLLSQNAQNMEMTESVFERAVQATRILKGLPAGTGADLKEAMQQLRRGVDAMRKTDSGAAARWESVLQAEQLW